MRAFFGNEGKVSLVLLRVLERISHYKLILVEISLFIESGPVFGQSLDVILLEPSFKLQEFLEKASGHLKARFFGVHKLEGLDESPAKALHQHD